MSSSRVVHLDRGLLIVLFLLLGFGLVQVYSSSLIYSVESYNNGLHFFTRQMAFAVLSLVTMVTVAYLSTEWIERWGVCIWGVVILAMIATMIPGVVVRAGGAARWLQLPMGLRFEPSELMKVMLPMLWATYLSRRSPWMGKWEWPAKALAMVLPFIILLKQPDFGSFAIAFAVSLTILFAFGFSWRFIAAGLGIMAVAFYFLIATSPYRMARVLGFLDPWKDPAKNGFQVIQSLLSFHSGGITGVGLGQGQGKLFFLPEAHTDFILAVVGEEMGFIGFVVLLCMYGYLIFRGLQISMQLEEKFHRTLALGLTVNFAYSVFINMGVVLGLVPPKGLTLPFMSYGGSSLLMNGLAFGLLLNLERHSRCRRVFAKKKNWRVHIG